MAKKHIVLGVSGGIAAYKTPLLARLLIQAGYEIVPVLTEAAERFVTTTVLSSITGNRCRNSLWDEEAEQHMGHIELARWADLVIVAPATADVISQFAHGAARDLLSTLILATEADVILAPSMNEKMWMHPATQRNIEQLENDGVRLCGPDAGSQACGDFGEGRMSEPEMIFETIERELRHSNSSPWLNQRVLITAGPTREAIDPVRYLSNASSGRQGFALAKVAQQFGATTTLVSGPVELSTPSGVRRLDVISAIEMHEVVMREAPKHDIFLSVAAVSDFRPIDPTSDKIKKGDLSAPLELRLAENPDILADVARSNDDLITIGFAAETNNILEYAREKLAKKNIDAIVVNDVGQGDIGFHSDNNAVTLIFAGHEKHVPKAPKEIIARQILESIGAELLMPSSSVASSANGQ